MVSPALPSELVVGVTRAGETGAAEACEDSELVGVTILIDLVVVDEEVLAVGAAAMWTASILRPLTMRRLS